MRGHCGIVPVAPSTVVGVTAMLGETLQRTCRLIKKWKRRNSCPELGALMLQMPSMRLKDQTKSSPAGWGCRMTTRNPRTDSMLRMAARPGVVHTCCIELFPRHEPCPHGLRKTRPLCIRAAEGCLYLAISRPDRRIWRCINHRY